jgi:hypothetical protein
MHMLTAEQYFQIQNDRIEADHSKAMANVNPDEEQARVAEIWALTGRKSATVTQMQIELRRDLPNVQVNEWVSWVIFVPANATRSAERMETLSGFVTAIDRNSGRLTVTLQCFPDDSKELGYEHGKDASVPVMNIIQVMKPQPIVTGGPTFKEAHGPAFKPNAVGEFVKGGV